MIITSISTRKFLPPKDSLNDLLAYINDLQENDVVVVTSKVVSICEGRCIERSAAPKNRVVRNQLRHCMQTTGVRFPYNGIDVSNGNGYYILLPEDPLESADDIRKILKEKFGIKNLGVIITDSIRPNFRISDRRSNGGLIALCIASSGINPLKNYIGVPDLFELPMRESMTAITDSIAVAANLVMGEGAECRPLAIVRAPEVEIEFVDNDILEIER